MKKTLVLASLLAAFGAASAQSTVTIAGSTSFGYQKTYGFAGQSLTPTTTPVVLAAGFVFGQLPAQQTKGIAETDFSIIFRGTEQLGGGLAAVFSMELDNGSGTGQFRAPVSRKNTSIGLTGGFGTIGFANTRSAEVANMAFVGSVNNPDGFYDNQVFKRASVDAFGYTSARAAGFQWGVGVSESGSPVTTPASSDGNNVTGARTTSLSANYAMGPLALAAAYRYSADNTGASAYRRTNMELGATYDLGVAKIGFGIDTKPAVVGAVATAAGVNAINGLLAVGVQDKMAMAFGVNVPFGTSSLGLNYAKRGDAKLVELGFQNNLSARTNVNFSVGSATRVGTVAGAKATDTRGQYRLSLNHAF